MHPGPWHCPAGQVGDQKAKDATNPKKVGAKDAQATKDLGANLQQGKFKARGDALVVHRGRPAAGKPGQAEALCDGQAVDLRQHRSDKRKHERLLEQADLNKLEDDLGVDAPLTLVYCTNEECLGSEPHAWYVTTADLTRPLVAQRVSIMDDQLQTQDALEEDSEPEPEESEEDYEPGASEEEEASGSDAAGGDA